MRSLLLTALEGIPEVRAGDDLAAIIAEALAYNSIALADGDVLVLAQKIVSKSEGCAVSLVDVMPSARARELANVTRKDPRLIELILGESKEVLRACEDVIVVEHRLGHVMANAGIDMSNVENGGETVLLLPLDPDASCVRLRATFGDTADIGIVINDSFGRAWRHGVAGVALGVAGLPGLIDMRGHFDRFGRVLQATQIGFADELASAASLLMGQADEGSPVIHARGVPYARRNGSAKELLRSKNTDLFR